MGLLQTKSTEKEREEYLMKRKNIIKHIHKLGLTQTDIARELNVSKQYISSFLNGTTDNVELEVKIWQLLRKTLPTKSEQSAENITS